MSKTQGMQLFERHATSERHEDQDLVIEEIGESSDETS